jgi:malate synthase
VPSGGVTHAGLIHTVSVAILFICDWFKGDGQFFGATEDSATRKNSRLQIGKWIRHQICMIVILHVRFETFVVSKCSWFFNSQMHHD